MPARKTRKSPQHKLTVPPGEWRDIREAMEWDGIANFSQFALAALRQRVRRCKRERQLEEELLKKRG